MTNKSSNNITVDERRNLILAHPFFALLNNEDIKELALLMKEISIPGGEEIVKEGKVIDKLYLIAKGSAEVLREITVLDKANEVFLGNLTVGDAIGLSESDFFSKNGIRTATVVATSDMVLLSIDIDSFNKFMQKSGRLYTGLNESIKKMLIMNFIRQIAPFKDLSSENVIWLARSLKEVSCPENTYIFRQGDKSDFCYLLVSGKVEIWFEKQGEPKKLFAVLEPPEIFGESSPFLNSERNATALCKTSCQLLSLQPSQLLQIIKLDKGLDRWLMDKRFKQSRPTHAPDIAVNEKVTADGQRMIVLKDSHKHHKYYQLTKEEEFLWEKIDGEHTVEDILNVFSEKYKLISTEDSLKVIYSLAKKGFVMMPSQLLDFKGEKSIMENLKTKINSFIKELKTHF